MFTFASSGLSYVSVLLTVGLPVHLYLGKEKSPFTQEQIAELALVGCSLCVHNGNKPSGKHTGIVISTQLADIRSKDVDGVIVDNTLYINNTERIKPAEILIIRKRLGTP